MDVVVSVRLYVNEMIRSVGPGMKVLLMDNETVRGLLYNSFYLGVTIVNCIRIVFSRLA